MSVCVVGVGKLGAEVAALVEERRPFGVERVVVCAEPDPPERRMANAAPALHADWVLAVVATGEPDAVADAGRLVARALSHGVLVTLVTWGDEPSVLAEPPGPENWGCLRIHHPASLYPAPAEELAAGVRLLTESVTRDGPVERALSGRWRPLLSRPTEARMVVVEATGPHPARTAADAALNLLDREWRFQPRRLGIVVAAFQGGPSSLQLEAGVRVFQERLHPDTEVLLSSHPREDLEREVHLCVLFAPRERSGRR